MGVRNLPKVLTRQRPGRGSNPVSAIHKSDALPVSHRATELQLGREKLYCTVLYCIVLYSTVIFPAYNKVVPKVYKVEYSITKLKMEDYLRT